MKKEQKILLVVPPSFLYPMGFAYVAAVLRKAGKNFDVFGFFYDDRAWFDRIDTSDRGKQDDIVNLSSADSEAFFFELVEREAYDLILLGGLVGFFRWFRELLPRLKETAPRSRLVLGGGITKDVSERMLFDHLGIDFILRGEAETNLTDFLAALENPDPEGGLLTAVPGLVCRDRQPDSTTRPALRLDLSDSSILPAWDIFNAEEYIKLSDTLFRMERTFFPILAGRGCPNVCAFCSPSVGRFLPRSVDSTISEMKHWADTYEFDFFFIYSEIAFMDEEFTREFCARVSAEIGKPWMGQIRTDVTFSVDTYRLMKDSGCMFINMGFESANDRVLKRMNKGTTVDDHLRNVNRAREAGLRVFGNFMFGHDSETAEEIRETFDFLNRYDLISGPANGLAGIIIYPGTKYHRIAQKRGLTGDPLDFLLTYSLKAGISSLDIRETEEKNKLNITSLPSDDYYNLICSENIKHRRLYARNHRVAGAASRNEPGNESVAVYRGTCPTCGNPLTFESAGKSSPLNISTLCRGCYYLAHLDLFGLPELGDHLRVLKDAIHDASEIVISGSYVMDLIFNPALDIPEDKIKGWIDPDHSECLDRTYFYHFRQISAADFTAGKFDLVINLQPGNRAHRRYLETIPLDPNCQILDVIPLTVEQELARHFQETDRNT